MTEPPTLFRLALHHTPSPTDPEGADEFYRAIGTLIVAWGRLETHFLACIMAIIQLPETQGLSTKLPNAWDERARIWRDAFHISKELKPHETDALKFLKEMEDVADFRNIIAHGFWDEFIEGPPIMAQVLRIRHHKGSTGRVEFFRSEPFTTSVLRSATKKISDLNIELQTLSSILNALRGQPPSNVRIL